MAIYFRTIRGKTHSTLSKLLNSYKIKVLVWSRLESSLNWLGRNSVKNFIPWHYGKVPGWARSSLSSCLDLTRWWRDWAKWSLKLPSLQLRASLVVDKWNIHWSLPVTNYVTLVFFSTSVNSAFLICKLRLIIGKCSRGVVSLRRDNAYKVLYIYWLINILFLFLLVLWEKMFKVSGI